MSLIIQWICLFFSIIAAAPQLLHVFHGGSSFYFLLVMKSHILIVPKNWKFLDQCSFVWLSSLTGSRSKCMSSTSPSARQNVFIAAELPPGWAQVRDPVVLGRNPKSSGRQLWSFSRQLQGFNTFPNSLPAALLPSLCKYRAAGLQNWSGLICLGHFSANSGSLSQPHSN